MHFFEADSVVVQHLHTKFFYLAWNCYVCCYVYNGWQAWYKTQARRTANTHRLFTSFLPLKKNLGEYDRSFLEVLAQDSTITTMHYWLAHLHENCTHPLFFFLPLFLPSKSSFLLLMQYSLSWILATIHPPSLPTLVHSPLDGCNKNPICNLSANA